MAHPHHLPADIPFEGLEKIAYSGLLVLNSQAVKALSTYREQGKGLARAVWERSGLEIGLEEFLEKYSFSESGLQLVEPGEL